MGAGPAVIARGPAGYTHLLNPRPWYKNTRTLLTTLRGMKIHTQNNRPHHTELLDRCPVGSRIDPDTCRISLPLTGS